MPRPHREPDARGRQGHACRLRHRQLRPARRDRAAGADGLRRAPRGSQEQAQRVSPRRNARAVAPRPKRHAASGKTRALGQHFLRDDAVAERMVGLVQPTRQDLVVEIGPGLGALTGRVAREAGRLLALEVDQVMATALCERFADAPHVEIFLADARSFNYAGLSALKPHPTGRVVVVGNLPYSVGKPILQALVEAGPVLDEMALMLQKEVAERVAAGPGGKTYGSLSRLTPPSRQARLAFPVPPPALRPPPPRGPPVG